MNKETRVRKNYTGERERERESKEGGRAFIHTVISRGGPRVGKRNTSVFVC